MRDTVDRWLADAERVAQAGRPRVAALLYAAALHFQPNSAEIATSAASTLLDLDRPEEAIAVLDPVLTQSADTPAFICRARAWIMLGEEQRAVDDAIEVLARNPASGQAASLLATLLADRGEIGRSVGVLGRAIDAGTNEAGLHVALAAGLRALNEPAAAREAAARGLLSHPAHPALNRLVAA